MLQSRGHSWGGRPELHPSDAWILVIIFSVILTTGKAQSQWPSQLSPSCLMYDSESQWAGFTDIYYLVIHPFLCVNCSMFNIYFLPNECIGPLLLESSISCGIRGGLDVLSPHMEKEQYSWGRRGDVVCFFLCDGQLVGWYCLNWPVTVVKKKKKSLYFSWSHCCCMFVCLRTCQDGLCWKCSMSTNC